MLKDLFINACILIASISIGNLIFHTPEIDTTRNRILVGIMSGILGIILMTFSVNITNHIILDFRNIAIILSSLYGGLVGAIFTGLVIGIFRLFYLNFTLSSVLGVITPIVMGIGCGLLANLQVAKWKKWTLVSSFTLFTATLSFSILINNPETLFNFLWPFWLGTGLLSVILYFYTDRLLEYDLLFYNLKKDASVDFLTGLNNVRQFDYIFNTAMLNAKQKKESLSLLYLDIDHFKKINDTYGHVEGDLILKQFGAVLMNTCRNVDFLFRKGGDEFAVLLLNCSAKAAVEIAQRIKTAVEVFPFQLASGKLNLTVSLGVATYPDTITEIELLCQTADMALYKAKFSGRNRIELI